MILGLGIDVVEIDRIERAVSRHGRRFAERMLSAYELEHLPEKHGPQILYLSARFAAKEAGSKALGTGFRRGVSLRTIEVRPQPSGKPELAFLGPALDLAHAMGVKNSYVSLTHGRDVAAAVVVLEG
ncbi:4'-phosphopantetheinyl transferase [Oceanidesulfovibrio indonesiensis]|uniref:Holo-[acyl-carrier-protein] synthase n=1 Tax=Oceanidesulfovibrio indonesiensis TaxID=54767 RepID=A0A7M3MCR6_9BACT|nr:holo-ACP synthase [Oceanidesulfovibrio indonesiensis]TVM15855.1 4'-phosphopantetheinyl transferase [Oceanidesulfovibrio indonesiensis]